MEEKQRHSFFIKFRIFFNKYSFVGLMLIIVSILINNYNTDNFFEIDVISNVISVMGTALLIGAIFDFAKNSDDFTIFVSNILKRIVVSRDFLGEMSGKEKSKALEILIKPTDMQMEQCSSIGQYYKKSIDSFIGLYNKQFKTNLSIVIEAKIVENKVICEGTVSHRRYQINGKYQQIITTFEKEDGIIDNSYILLPDGTRKNLSDDDIESKEKNELKGEKIGKKYLTTIPEEYNIYPYITLCKTIKEIGHDHWITFNWSSLTPCDGICFKLICRDNLKIKEYKVFDNPKLYDVNISENFDGIDILSTSWLDEYTGFTITISKSA